MTMRELFSLARGVKAILILVVLIGVAALLRERWDQPVTGNARAIDGDSLQLDDLEIRLIGIDAPELRQTCGTLPNLRPCGREARLFLAAVLREAKPFCTIEGIDRYQRSLAQCRIGERDVAAALVKAGWAIATDAYFTEEADAKSAKRGIWSGPFELPRDYRRMNGSMVE
jgi:endonuclease YncB( thermonuclease family)